MVVLNRVREMKQSGMNDAEVIQRLREEGASPLDIHQALEQDKIKSAVDNEQDANSAMYQEEMQPSVMQNPSPGQQISNPGNQEEYLPQQYSPQIPDSSQGYQQPQQYQPQEYESAPAPQYPQYAPPSSDSMYDIAEQITDEKLNSFRKKIGNVDELKIMLVKKVENIDLRLKKIEEVIDSLQKAIINKIGGFGDSVEQIKDEMNMMQESFSKALIPLVDKARKSSNKDKKHKKGDGFEHYMRR